MEGSNPKVTRRDALRLATAVGALGAGLGVTLKTGEALGAVNAYKEIQLKDVVSEKVNLTAAGLGTVSLKIAYLKADGSTQLLHSFDLTSHFLKLGGGEAVNFSIKSNKTTEATLLDRSIYIKG